MCEIILLIMEPTSIILGKDFFSLQFMILLEYLGLSVIARQCSV